MNRFLNAAALAALMALLPAASARAEDGRVFSSRTACLARAEALPDFALAEAKLWERQGGAADARLCQALAQLLRGEWEAAAPALEASATELAHEAATMRANLWSRAALAWSNARKPDAAEAAYGKAVALTPNDPQLLMDRAILRAGAERYWDAVADLDRVIDLMPRQSEAWLLRAQAHHVLALDAKAMNDVQEALRLSPQNSEALLLRGNLYAAKSNLAFAKRDWETVRRVAADSPAAQVALENLNALERAHTTQQRELKRQRQE
ncbi:hypothetical protein [Niveispirillum fermenti]|uniref:hypothetical protein n=1 Tax=Niveispirillum fermenti TaxID=1233113 RepID=UPI003A842E7A